MMGEVSERLRKARIDTRHPERELVNGIKFIVGFIKAKPSTPVADIAAELERLLAKAKEGE